MSTVNSEFDESEVAEREYEQRMNRRKDKLSFFAIAGLIILFIVYLSSL
jgi:hypothetical protein